MTAPIEQLVSAFEELALMPEKITITLELTPIEIVKLSGSMQLSAQGLRKAALLANDDVNLNHTAAVVWHTQGIILEQALKANPRLLELCEEIGVGSVTA
jgi:hypothetical protein